MVFNPNLRLTVDQALRHPYVAKFINQEEEIVLNKLVSIPMDENTKYSIKDYREMLYKEIAEKQKDSRLKGK